MESLCLSNGISAGAMMPMEMMLSDCQVVDQPVFQ